MTTSLVGIDEELMPLLIGIVDARDPALLASILESQNPTLEQRERVESLLADELDANIDAEHELNERAQRVHTLITQFLVQFPLEP